MTSTYATITARIRAERRETVLAMLAEGPVTVTEIATRLRAGGLVARRIIDALEAEGIVAVAPVNASPRRGRPPTYYHLRPEET